MLYLFADTETTGFARTKSLPSDEKQPHCVQLGAQLTTDTGEVLNEISLILDCDVDIPEKTVEIHGITKEKAALAGIPPHAGLAIFSELCVKADVVVGHNWKFDAFIIAIMEARLGFSSLLPASSECTMAMAKEITGKGSLKDAYKYFTGKDLVGGHDALVDTNACREVYFAIKNGDW